MQKRTGIYANNFVAKYKIVARDLIMSRAQFLENQTMFVDNILSQELLLSNNILKTETLEICIFSFKIEKKTYNSKLTV